MPKATPFDSIVAYKVRDARTAKGVVAAEVARSIGMSRQAYLELERGEYSFRVETLVRISKKLGVDVISLMPEESSGFITGAERQA